MVSTSTPLVMNITTTKPPGSGPYGVGDEIDVTVWFTEPVEVSANVTNTPRLRYRTQPVALVGKLGDYGRKLRLLCSVDRRVPTNLSIGTKD